MNGITENKDTSQPIQHNQPITIQSDIYQTLTNLTTEEQELEDLKEQLRQKKAKGGRPLRIKTTAELEKRINDFIQDCRNRKVPLTLSRLASSLGVSRTTIRDYESKEMYAAQIKKVKTLIEADLEERMLVERNPIGYYRSLSCSFEGWESGGNAEGTASTILRIEFTRPKKPQEPIKIN